MSFPDPKEDTQCKYCGAVGTRNEVMGHLHQFRNVSVARHKSLRQYHGEGGRDD